VVVVGGCTTGEVREPESLPGEAVAVSSEDLITDELAGVADLGEGDELYQLPAPDGWAVLVRIRTEEPPLLFGTSCDVVNSVPLPAGWESVCLEYTVEGRRVQGRFPEGTISIAAPVGDVAGFNSPNEAALTTARVDNPKLVAAKVSRMVVIYADQAMVDLRVQVEGDAFCQWYGVTGIVEAGRLTYRASPAMPCDQ
jgi:hypothetical protein